MAALTLIEAAKQMEDDFQSAVVSTFAETSPILQVLPFDTIQGGALRFNREGTLPTTAFRAINAPYATNAGVLEPVVEPLMLIGGDLDVDKFLVKTGGPGIRSGRVAMKIKHLAHSFGHYFIKGSNEVDGTQFNGLQVRCGGSQLIEAAASPASGGDVLSLARLDLLLERVPGATHLIMSQRMVTLLTAAARTTTVGGYIVFTQNQFGNRQAFYNGIPILELGGPDQVFSTLDFTEAAPNGAQATTTSIYAVRIGTSGLVGIQNSPPEASDLGETDVAPVFRTRLDWFPGLSNMDKWCLARLRGIKTGAVTA